MPDTEDEMPEDNGHYELSSSQGEVQSEIAERIHRTMMHGMMDANFCGQVPTTYFTHGFIYGIVYAIQYARQAIRLYKFWSEMPGDWDFRHYDLFASQIDEILPQPSMSVNERANKWAEMRKIYAPPQAQAPLVTPEFDKDGKLVWEKVRKGEKLGRWLPEWPENGG